MPVMDAIRTLGLTKRYGRVAALSDFDLRVPAGRLFGFLGPNGAGKTTAIRLLLGLLRASSGRAEVLGRDVWREGPRLRRDVGYLPGDVRFYDWMSGAALLRWLDRTRGGGAAPEQRRLSDVFELELGRRIRDYSRGMKQKLGLIATLMHRPRLLILDEPTTALDPLVREALAGELRAAVAEGRTVLFSSHTLAEVEALCDEVAILRRGRLVEHERVDVLRRRALRRVEITFRDGRSADPPPAFSVVRRGPAQLSGIWRGPVAPLLGWLAAAPVEDVTLAPPNLEDLFMTYYTGAEQAEAPRPSTPERAG